jgi:hypothetical protein
MKRFKLLMIGFFLIPVFGFGQELTGMWTGVLNTDSNRIRKDKFFELALTEYRGKVYGYTHSEFMVDDTLYYILKRVKGTVEGDSCVVTDDKIVSCNFISRLDKGVKQSYTFHLDKVDSVWRLDGKWKTELETKKARRNFYSVGGSVKMAEEKDLTKSKIFPHLQELNLMNDVAAIESKNKNNNKKNEKPVPVIAKANPAKEKEPVNNADKGNKNTESNKTDIAKAATKNQTEENNKKEGLKNSTVVAANPKKNAEQANANNKEKQNSEASKTDIAELNVKTGVEQTDTFKVTNGSPELSNQVAVKTKSEKQKKQDKKPENSEPVIVKSDIKNGNEKKDNNGIAAAGHETSQPVAKTNPVNEKETPGLVTAKPGAKNGDEKKDNNGITAAGHETSQPVAKTNPVNEKETSINKIDNNKPIESGPVLTKSQSRREKRQQEKQARNEASVAETNLFSTKKPGNDNPVVHAFVPAADATKREIIKSETVNFKNDSLQIALYDNGEIDGDTVSVLLNGKLIMANEGLKATAIRKTIYISPDQDSVELVFYAENLGKYPPNTGLMIVHDGDDVYQVHFSSDLQRSAGVILRRKKN